jgi:uncharacterized protein YwgA
MTNVNTVAPIDFEAIAAQLEEFHAKRDALAAHLLAKRDGLKNEAEAIAKELSEVNEQLNKLGIKKPRKAREKKNKDLTNTPESSKETKQALDEVDKRKGKNR